MCDGEEVQCPKAGGQCGPSRRPLTEGVGKRDSTISIPSAMNKSHGSTPSASSTVDEDVDGDDADGELVDGLTVSVPPDTIYSTAKKANLILRLCSTTCYLRLSSSVLLYHTAWSWSSSILDSTNYMFA